MANKKQTVFLLLFRLRVEAELRGDLWTKIDP
jgi:hypothetical protein